MTDNKTSIEITATDKTQAAVTSARTGIESLEKAAGLLGISLSSIALGSLIKDSALLDARFETMGVVMKVAGNNAGYTEAQMNLYSEALQKSGISMLQSRDALTQLATAHIDLGKAQALGRAAQDLAVVGNTNSSAALASMVHAIKANSVEVLRTLGLNVSFEQSYKKMASQLGTTSDKLSEQQKILARTNATLEAAAAYNGIYEESMTTAGKAISSLTRYWEDLKIKAGEAFLPALADIVFRLTDALKAANKELTVMGGDGTMETIGTRLASALNYLAVLGSSVAYVFSQVGKEIGTIAAGLMALASGNIALLQSIGQIRRAEAKEDLLAAAAFQAKMLKERESAVTTSTYNETARIAAGKASMEKAAADDKAMHAAEASVKASKKAAEEMASLSKAMREKIIVAKAELAEDEKMTASQKEQVTLASKIAELHREFPRLSTAKLTALGAELGRILDLNDAKKLSIRLDEDISKRYADAVEKERAKAREIIDGTRALRENTAEMGLSDDALLALHKSRIDDQIAIEQQRLSLAGLNDVESEQTTEIRAQIAALQDRKIAMDEQSVAAKTMAGMRAQVDMWKSIDDAARQTFISIFDSGKSAFDRLRDSLKNGIMAMLYELTVKKFIVNVVASVSGTAVATQAFGATAGTVGGVGSSISTAISAFSSFGGSISTLASLISTGAGVLDIAGISLGSTFATLAGGIGLAITAVSLLSSLFSKPNHNADPAGAPNYSAFVQGNLQNTASNAAVPIMWQGARNDGGQYSGNTWLGAQSSQDVNAAVMSLFSSYSAAAQRAGISTAALTQTIAVNSSMQTSVEAAVRASLLELSDLIAVRLIPNIAKYKQANETTAAAFERLTNDTASVETIINILGRSFRGAGSASIDLSQKLLALFGGLTNAQTAFSAYYDNFYSEAEKQARIHQQLTDGFKQLNLIEPTTRAGFKHLVESLDLTTDAGMLTFAALMNMQAAFAQVVPAIDAVASAATNIDAARSTLIEAHTAVRAALVDIGNQVSAFAANARTAAQAVIAVQSRISQAYWQVQDEMVSAQARVADATTAATQGMQTFAKSIDAFLAGIDQGTTGLGTSSLKAILSSTAVLAKAGDLDAQAKLVGLAGQVLKSSEASSTGRSGYARDQAFVRELMTDVRDTVLNADVISADMVKANQDVAIAQAKANEYAALVVLSGSSTTRPTDTTAIGLMGEYNAASDANALAQANYNSAKILSSQTSVVTETSINGLLASLAKLSAANTALAIAQAAASIAGNATASVLTITADSARLLATRLGLTGNAAQTFEHLLLAPATAAQTLAAALGMPDTNLLAFGKSLGLALPDIASLIANIGLNSTAFNNLTIGATTVGGSVGRFGMLLDTAGLNINDFIGIMNTVPVGTAALVTAIGSAADAALRFAASLGGTVIGPAAKETWIGDTWTSAAGAVMNRSTGYATAGNGGGILPITAIKDGIQALFQDVADGKIAFYDAGVQLINKATAYGMSARSLDELMGWPAGQSNSWATANGLPAFASGGMHGGGWAVVGEHGPELANFSSPARIYSAGQSTAIMGAASDEMVSEIRALRDEVKALRVEAAKTSASTRKTSDTLVQVTRGGISMLTEAA